MERGPTLRVGDSLNRVFALYQENFGVLIPAAFWLFLPVSILGGIVGNKQVGLLALVAIVTFAVAMLYQGVVVSLVREVQGTGARPSVGELIGSVGPVLPTLLITAIIYGFGVGIGIFLLVVPGLILLTIWAVIAPVIVIERVGVSAAFTRSQNLVKGFGWPVFGTVLSATLIAAVATLILTGIAEAIAGGPILRIVFGTLATTLTAPIGGLVAAVLYFRLLELKPDPPAAEAPPPPPPPVV